jgi:PAS domain S-box-containing protein
MDLSKTHIRDLLDTAPDATVIVDETGSIIFANTHVKSVFGHEPEMLIGMAVETLLPERFRATHGDHRASFANAPLVRPMGSGLTLYGRRQDGSEFPIEISLNPLNTKEELVVSCVIRDITERLAFESALNNATQVAELATRTKSRFLAAASHDLRQPLQSIAIYLGVLKKTLRQEPDTALAVCAKMDKSLDVMGELLDALLSISMLDSGSITPEKRDFPVQTLFDQLSADNTSSAEEKGLSLIVEPTTEVVHTDLALLQRIVENFTTNAIRYTETGSVTVVAQRLGDQLHIEVRDTGIGIPETSLDTIFDEYFQLDNPVRDRRKGLGLGLSIVKNIAMLLGTPLDVSSIIGEGSSFAVTVPTGLPMADETPVATPKAAGAHRGEPVILFVDDDPAIVDATTMLLRIAGIHVKTALDGDAAIAMLDAGFHPDMVISDYRLPGANGIEVVQHARAQCGYELPIVLMTGDTAGKAIEDAKLSNYIVLHKPVDTDNLIELIEASLNLVERPAA